MDAIHKANEIKARISGSIDRLSGNPDVLEALSSQSFLVDYHLKELARTNTSAYVFQVREALAGFL